MSDEKVDYCKAVTVSTAFFGFFASAGTAVGAEIKNHNVEDEAITQMVGGLISGPFFGYLWACVCNNMPEEDGCERFLKYLTELFIIMVELSTAPAIGESWLDRDTNVKDVQNDTALGISILTLALCGCFLGTLALTSCLLKCIEWDCCGHKENSRVPDRGGAELGIELNDINDATNQSWRSVSLDRLPQLEEATFSV